MDLDAIVIADTGQDGVARPNALSPPSFRLNGKPATVQAVLKHLAQEGGIMPGLEDRKARSWWSAPRYNGLFLLSHLIKHGFKAELVNKYYEEKGLFHSLMKRSPKAVILSTTFILTKRALHKLVDDIRASWPDLFIIAGGPFVYKSFLFLQRSREDRYVKGGAADDFLFFTEDEIGADLYIISREGEQVLCEALNRIEKNISLGDLPNTARLERGKYSFTPFKDEVLNSGNTPVDWKSLPDAIFESGVIPMQASGGCPYRCAFCSFRKDDRFQFLKPVNQLIDEIKEVSGRGVRYVRFIDDNFRLGVPDLQTFCRRMIDSGIQIHWMTMIKINTLENMDADLLRRAGCLEVALGLESADAQVLQNMNKKATPAGYGQVIQKLLQAGINCSCYFLFGFPGETDETALRTRQFIKSIEHPELDGILSWNLYSFCLTPLSPIYEPRMREKHGLNGYMDDWQHRTMDSKGAEEHVRQALGELEHSCPIYRGDDLDIVLRLMPRQRKSFYLARYQLAKIGNEIGKEDILQTFRRILMENPTAGTPDGRAIPQ